MNTAKSPKRAQPKMKNLVFLFWINFVLVGLTPLIVGLFYCYNLIWPGLGEPGGPARYLLLAALFSEMLWFLPPGLLIGEPIFDHGSFCLYPRGLAGWVITILFYVLISFGLWGITFVLAPKCPRPRGRNAEQNAGGNGS
jgi:hypothetical protein